jgi:hypothetical protein
MLVRHRLGVLVLVVASIVIATSPASGPPLRAAQAGTESPATFDVSPSVVTAVSGLLQTTGQSSPVTVSGYPLPDGQTATVTLQAFPLWQEHAEISIPSDKGFVASGRPRFLTQLLGHVKGSRATTVQLRMSDQGLTGFVIHQGVLHRQTFAANRVTFRSMGTAAPDPASNASLCALDRAPGKPVVGRAPVFEGEPGGTVEEYMATLDPVRPPRPSDALAAFCCVSAPGPQLKFYDVAVETDDELMMRMHLSSPDVQRHVTDLIAAVNAIYWNANSNVLFRLRWFHIYQAGHNGASFDIFDQDDFMESGNSFERIAAVRNLWLTDPDRVHKTSINRDIVLLVSGTSLGGSSIMGPWECRLNGQRTGQLCNLGVPGQCSSGTCQWVGEPLCDKTKAFAAVEFQDNAADPVATQIQATAHELGHLFGAEHAECTDTIVPASVPPADPIDRCRNTSSSLRGDACWRNADAPPPGDIATVMSVCASYFRNITLGQAFHPASAQAISQASNAGACGKPASVTLMQNAVPMSNLQSTTQAGRHYFAIDVPPSSSRLVITTQGTGELTLYGRFGTLPTTWGTYVSNVAGTANQRIEVPARAGRWYILLFGWNGFSGVTLTAEHN